MSLYLPPPKEMSEELKKCLEEWRKLFSQIVSKDPNICIDCLAYLPEEARQAVAKLLTDDPDKQLHIACRMAIYIAKKTLLNQEDSTVLKDLSKITGLSEEEIAKKIGFKEGVKG
ncbi:MAG: hypothetical protein DRO09_01710 [Thermoprotei archaeon]|nr:MAG: hypothetical protein DRO09_01710 [Thermoprotei archaeon]